MATHAQASGTTATGDTVETSIGTITITQKASRIVAVWAYAMAGAIMTSAESITGIVRFASADLSLAPLSFPLHLINILTSGAIGFNPQFIPVNLPSQGNPIVEGFVTMDMAQTGALVARFGVVTQSGG